MAALNSRRHTGVGQHVDISIMHTNVAMHDFQFASWMVRKVIDRRTGNRQASPSQDHPWAMYPCKDGWVSATVYNDANFRDLCIGIGMLDLAEDPRFKTSYGRLTHADELDSYLVPWLMEHTRHEIIDTFQELRIPSSPLPTFKELLDDPHYNARGFWVDIEHPATGSLTYPGAPFKMTETPWQKGRAPLLGEHNEEIYCECLGYTKEELTRLRAMGVI